MGHIYTYKRKKNWYLIRRSSLSFFGSQWAGGIMLIIFAVAAMVLANLDATKEVYQEVLSTYLGFQVGDWKLMLSLEHWINDGLMVIFFFVVGLEIKTEVIAGKLSTIKQASLPIAAAIGGMIIPALIYVFFNLNTVYEDGWGVPMATDIAFAIGILSLLGNKVPLSLKVFLTALAIVDDLGAILVIAIFYTSQIKIWLLIVAFTILGVLYWMNTQGVKRTSLYIAAGIVVWFLFLHSGVHATISGVLLAMVMPTIPKYSKKYFSYKVKYFLENFKQKDCQGVEVLSNENQLHALEHVKSIAYNTTSISQRLEHALHPLIAFVIMPIFALANAGVEVLDIDSLQFYKHTQGLGVFFGLVLGKPIGIAMFSWLAIKLKWAVMPAGADMNMLWAVSCLGGIGFTMSIFITNLAFDSTQIIDAGKIVVLIASVVAAGVGVVAINFASKKSKHNCR